MTKRRLNSNPPSEYPALGDRLTWGVLNFPDLMDELPLIIHALDCDESINIVKIPDLGKREFLLSLVAMLPVVSEMGLYRRSSSDISIAKYLHLCLNQSGEVVENLSEGQNLAFRYGIPRILRMIGNFPDIRVELPSFLSNILEGNGVLLDGIEDEDLKDNLAKLMRSIGMEQTIVDGNDEFNLPSDEASKSSVVVAIRSLLRVFDCLESEPQLPVKFSDPETTHPVDSQPLQLHKIGPYMPTQKQLQEAQLLSQTYHSFEDEDHEQEVGPVPIQRSGNFAMSAGSIQVPIGGIEIKTSDQRIEDLKLNQSENIKGEGQREEWMMTPGENKSIADLYKTTGTIATRKFQTGKQAKQMAEAYSHVSKEFDSMKSSASISDDLVESRGPSLMDLHQEKKKSKQNSDSTMRRAFDRDQDVLSRRRLGDNEAEELVEKSKQLESRFERGSVQARFY